MIYFDPFGKDRLAFLRGRSNIHQYRLLLSIFGNQAHGIDRVPTLNTLNERIYGTQVFIDTLCTLYGAILSPLELKPENFIEVISVWKTTIVDENQFALLAKVAAWLYDLCIDCEISPFEEYEGELN